MEEEIEVHGDGESLELEITGEGAYKKAQTILEATGIEQGSIRYVSIEFLTEPPESSEGISDVQSQLGDMSEYGEITQSPPEDDEEGSEGTQTIPTLREGTKRRKLLKHLDNMNRFAGTKEIRNHMSSGLEKNVGSSLSNDLWELADRGLIEKKDKDDKGHLNEYKITDKGRKALRQ